MTAAEEGAPVVTPEIAAETAVWVARLHGPDRSQAMEREFLAWQARSAANRLAFERSTDTWQDAAGAGRLFREMTKARPPAPASSRVSIRRTRPWMAAVATIVLAGALVMAPWRSGQDYETGVGEQRMVVLEDGSRLSLNTDTRVRVEFSSDRRRVRLEAGEALFEVAKDARRPFAVHVAGREVLAIGTAFTVRLDARESGLAEAAVTLVEGEVVVRRLADGGERVADMATAQTLKVGDRLRFAGSKAARDAEARELDRPRIDQVLAWKRGEAIFDDIALSAAIAEMNRYSALPIRLVGFSHGGELRISGTFKVGDNRKFARAVATLHGLTLDESSGRLDLSSLGR